MYSVKLDSTKALKTWYQETPAGLQSAIEECEMRTHATNQPHIVTDNNGFRLHLSLPAEVKQRLQAQRAEEGIPKWLSIIAALLLILAIFARR